MDIQYRVNDRGLTAEDFLALAQGVWPGAYDTERVRQALTRTDNTTAWDDAALVGCVRVLSDGYFFGTIPEILVLPAYRRRGIGSRLLALAWETSPTSLLFGVQPGNEVFFEKSGFTRSLPSWARKKPRGS
jgi:ribosomal protein S18 acetylase RimI-like enzyme